MTSEHRVRLHPAALEATVDGETWLAGSLRFGMDGPTCVAGLIRRPQTAYEHGRWLWDSDECHPYSPMVFGLFKLLSHDFGPGFRDVDGQRIRATMPGVETGTYRELWAVPRHVP